MLLPAACRELGSFCKIFVGPASSRGNTNGSRRPAARGLLGSSQQMGVGIMTVHQLEQDGTRPWRATLAAVQRALFERTAAFGRLEQRKLFRAIKDETAFMVLYYLGGRLGKIRPKCAVDPLPSTRCRRCRPRSRRAQPERSAARLPDLLRLHRYERRAAARGDRAIRRLTQSED